MVSSTLVQRFLPIVMVLAIGTLVSDTRLRAEDGVALRGLVTSQAEGPMEGVLVSAKKRDSTITITIATDRDGRFTFPATKLTPGHYALSIRAVGYDLAEPTETDVVPTRPATIDLTLRPTEDLAAQLTNAEWLVSFPGTDEQKRPLLECMSCHTLERIARSTHHADEWVSVLERMAGYANNTTLDHPQRRAAERRLAPERARKTAEYLARINLSAGPWTYPLKTHARPTGRATRVVITEYALPRASIAPHDVRVDRDGVWYSDFSEQFLGRLDPATGGVTEYPIPELKPGFPTGALDMEIDHAGNLWLAMMFQTGLAKFDRQQQTFQMFSTPPELDSDTMQQSMVMPRHSDVDGKVWTNDVNRHAILRLDLTSGQFDVVDPFKSVTGEHVHAPYGMMADAENNLYFLDFGDQNIGRVDAKTLRVTLYPTPTTYSRPRRGMLDAAGELWFAEFAANQIGMFDTNAERFQEWPLPTPWTAPYDVASDERGDIWAGSMASDRVIRFDRHSGAMTEYLLPHQTNIRRVFVDNSVTPATMWIGNNHHASIVKLEPLD
jgi:virginiamycin B lyase